MAIGLLTYKKVNRKERDNYIHSDQSHEKEQHTRESAKAYILTRWPAEGGWRVDGRRWGAAYSANLEASKQAQTDFTFTAASAQDGAPSATTQSCDKAAEHRRAHHLGSCK